MALLSEDDRKYLQGEFGKMNEPVKLILFSKEDDCASCSDTLQLLEETASLSEKIEVVTYDLTRDSEAAATYNVDRAPTVIIQGNKDIGIRLYGIPSGYEFSTLIEDIIDLGTGTISLAPATKDALAHLAEPVHIQVFVTPSCPYCPKAVRMAHMMAMESDKVTADMVMANEFPQLSSQYNVMAVPKIVINEDTSFEGAIPEDDYVSFVAKATSK
ncbi:MAG: thioredoxin family protein [Candidatus Bipolaricaulota bacterium]|nr:thioredoxin family protein [Candidatus Bipolaricaulota bacterium]